MNTKRLLSLLLLTIATPTFAQSEASPPIVNATTFLVAKINPVDTNLPPWLDAEQSSRLSSAATSLRVGLEALKTISPNDDFFVAFDIPFGKTQPVTRMLIRNREGTRPTLTKTIRVRSSQVIGDYVVFAPGHPTAIVAPPLEENVLPSTRSRFAEAMDVVKQYPVQLLIAPPDYIRTTFEQAMPELPAELGGGRTSVLTDGICWASIGIDPAILKVVATIQSESDIDAKTLAEKLPTFLNAWAALTPEPSRDAVQLVTNALVESMNVSVRGNRITITSPLGQNDVTRSLLTQVADIVLGPVSRGEKRKQFRQIVLGMLNFESANSEFPPAKKHRDENGKPGLSWRVRLLPYLGDEELKLWKRFHLDEPWDSPHNKTLLADMPDVYNAQSRFTGAPNLKPGYTTYLAPVGDGTIFGRDEVTKFRDVRDGSSKTLVLVEVKSELAVPWTAPQDYRFDIDDPASGLAFERDDIVLGAFCDGHVAELKRSNAAKTFLYLFQMNDEQPVPNLK